MTLGGVRFDPIKRHPTVQDRVLIGAGAKVLGPIEIGAGARVGANAVVTKSVPAGTVVFGPKQEVTPPDAIRIGMRIGGTKTDAVLIAYAILEDGSTEVLSIGG